MEYTANKITLQKSKSLLSLPRDDNLKLDYKAFCQVKRQRTCSESSADVCTVLDDGERKRMVDSGIGDRMLVEGDILAGLEQKIDRLSEAFLEQCGLLNTLKQDIRNSKAIMEKSERAHNQIIDNVLNTDIQRMNNAEESAGKYSSDDSDSANSRAKSLLSAIEAKQNFSIDHEIRDSLIKFLQSDELKDQMVSATAASVRELIGGCLSRDVSSLYLPVLQRTHRRHLAHIHRIVGQAFEDLEEKSSSLFESVYKTSDVVRRALERHQGLLEAAADPGKDVVNTFQYAVEEVLHKELSEWRQKVLAMFSAPEPEPEPLAAVPSYLPTTPPQPADPDASIVDQLMNNAYITKKLEEGDVNGSFERALCAGDVALVTAACRRAAPAHVFAPRCRLRQPVLLSLVQQLATDMLHETHLKCRYLEEAIINLDPCHPDTRAHLPLVVGEVRRHLTGFLTAYPNHVANRRITLIVMAANNLLK